MKDTVRPTSACVFTVVANAGMAATTVAGDPPGMDWTKRLSMAAVPIGGAQHFLEGTGVEMVTKEPRSLGVRSKLV